MVEVVFAGFFAEGFGGVHPGGADGRDLVAAAGEEAADALRAAYFVEHGKTVGGRRGEGFMRRIKLCWRFVPLPNP